MWPKYEYDKVYLLRWKLAWGRLNLAHGVIWFGVFMYSEKPNYTSTSEHTNSTAEKNSWDMLLLIKRITYLLTYHSFIHIQ